MKLVTVSQATEMDRTAIEEYSIPELLLMENAAGAALRVIKEVHPVEETGFLVLCGPGNNGGDGLALARLLYSRGGAPVVLLSSSPENLKGSAKANFDILKNYPIEVIPRFSRDRLRKELEDTDVVIDALLGTGLSRDISGDLAENIKEINQSGKIIFSIDIPTGVNGDTGQIMGTAVKADYTTTFGAPKPGNLLYPGYPCNGQVYLSRISFPPEIYDSPDFKMELNLCPALPLRDESGHKKSFGDILTIAGAGAYYGAPFFASASVLKCGAGFSRLAAPSSMIPVLAGNLPEAVFLPMEETGQTSIALSNLQKLLREADKSDGTVIGPGLSLNSRTAEMICAFVRSHKGFTVIDGDALSAVAGKFHLFENREIPAVLTPHTGEMARLCASTAGEISSNPLKYVQLCSEQYNSIVVLKGPHSLIGLPGGKVFINTSGNSGLGTAGSGDILAGIIGGLYGTGLSPEVAVRTAVFLHGAAGDLAARELGKDGLTARDILDNVAPAVKKFRENYHRYSESNGNIIKEI